MWFWGYLGIGGLRFVTRNRGLRMDEAQGGSNSLPPFLVKMYEMVDNPSTNSVVSWSPTNKNQSGRWR